MIGAELQKEIFTALEAVLPNSVFDNPPEKPVFPYITIGDEQTLDDGNSCSNGWEIFTDVHIWSRPEKGSKKEVKDLRAQVFQAVLTITEAGGQKFVAVSLDSSRVLRDPDGLTEHAVLTFRFLT